MDTQGRVILKPHGLMRETHRAEQSTWASQSDMKVSEMLQNIAARGGRAFDNAGALCRWFSQAQLDNTARQ